MSEKLSKGILDERMLVMQVMLPKGCDLQGFVTVESKFVTVTAFHGPYHWGVGVRGPVFMVDEHPQDRQFWSFSFLDVHQATRVTYVHTIT